MPNVPILPVGDAQVNAGMAPSARIEPITPEASGVNVAKAAEGAGRQAESFGRELSLGLVYQMRQRQADEAYAADADFRQKLQDVGRPFLDRRGRQAIGITAGTPPNENGKDDPNGIKYKDSFSGQAQQLFADMRKKYSGRTLQMFDRSAQSAITTWRESMIQHEAKQHEVARDQIDNARHKAIIDTAAIAPNAEEFKKQMLVGDEVMANMGKRKGIDMSNADEAKQHLESSHSDFFKSFLQTNIETNPQLTEKVLESIKSDLSPEQYAGFKKTIEGKTIDDRRAYVWDQVSQFRHPDGTVDILKAETTAKKMAENMPAHHRQQILDYIKSQASVENSAMRDARQAQDRSFFNDASALKQKGVDFNQAEQQLFKGKGYGVDAADHENKRQQLMKLYTKEEDWLAEREKHLSPEEKFAWKQVEDWSKAKFGKQMSVLPGDEATGIKSPMADAFMLEAKRKMMGQPSENILEGAKKMLENKVVEPRRFWFDKKMPAWEVERSVRTLGDQEMFALNQQPDYSPYVGPMRQALIDAGRQNPSARDIRDAIDKYRKK